LEGSDEKEKEDVVDAELVADALGEGEPVDEGDAEPVLRAVRDMGADAVPAAETEVVVEAEPDAVRGPVDVADALSDPRPLTVTGGSRELVVVEEGEKETTVAEAVAERVEKFEKVAIAEVEPSDEIEALAEADSEGEPEAVEVRLPPPVPVTEEEDDTVGELESRPVLVGVEELEGEPVEDMVFTAEAVGVEELEGKLENVGWPEAVSFEDCEAVDDAERTPLALVVEDAELLSEIVATGVVVADAELDSVPDSEADPVTDRVPLTDPDGGALPVCAAEKVAEMEGLPETVAESSTEGDPFDVGVWDGEASTEGVAHVDANGEAVAAVVPVGGGELEAPMVRVPVDAKDGDSRAEMLAELETV
jgi:hypothetical protein